MSKLFIRLCSLYKDWDDDKAASWEKKELSGFAMFVIKEGILKWGAISCMFFLVATLQNESESQYNLFITSFVWLCASCIYGTCLWVATRESYKIYKKKV